MKRMVAIIRTRYATYAQEMVYCRKETCSTCPHGPYWYAYLRVKTKKILPSGKPEYRRVVKYIGRSFRYLPGDPGDVREAFRKKLDGTVLMVDSVKELTGSADPQKGGD